MKSEKTKLFIDRIEEDKIVAFSSNGRRYNIPRGSLRVKEGDVVLVAFGKNGEIADLSVFKEETSKRKVSLLTRLGNIFKNQGV